MNTEAMAQAMFEKLHGMNSRPRNWRNAPDEDFDVELGRNTFRAMAEAAAAVASFHPLDVLAANTPEAASMAHEAVFGTPLPTPVAEPEPEPVVAEVEAAPAVEAEPVAAEVAPVAANDAAPVEPGAA